MTSLLVLLLLLPLIFFAFVSIILFVFRVLIEVYISFQGSFYAPSSKRRIRNIIELAKIDPSKKIADLGSGDARVLIAIAKEYKKIKCTGFELDPFLVWKSIKKIKKHGFEKNITINRQNFWTVNLGKFDTIIIYAIKKVMPKLEKKIKKEAKKGARIISVYCLFPTLGKSRSIEDVHLYKI